MKTKTRTAIIATLITLCLSMILTLLAWAQVVRLEYELAIQKSDVYILKLVQAELLKQHGLHLELARSAADDAPVPKIEHDATEEIIEAGQEPEGLVEGD